MSLQFLKNELVYEVDVSHPDKYESLLQVDSIIFTGFGQACPNYPGKFAIYLLYFKEEVWDEVRDLTALAGSNTTLTIYYTSNVLPPFTLFLSQFRIHTKLFLHLIICLCNISLLLLFQVTVGPCKFACLKCNFLYQRNTVYLLMFFETYGSCVHLPPRKWGWVGEKTKHK